LLSLRFLFPIAVLLQGCITCNEEQEVLQPEPTLEERIQEDWEFTIISVGDIMLHDAQLRAGWDAATKSYDFSFMFERVAPILREGDLVIGNLETPLAGAEQGYSGYPMFNAPEILAKNLKDAGFTLVSTANNHMRDRKFRGLYSTLEHLDAAGLLHAGSFRAQEEREKILITSVRGVRIGVIGATYSDTKVLPKPEFALYYIDEERLLADIKKARQDGAQYVILMLHWGDEYKAKPNREQTRLAQVLLEGGADLILGNHSHVLQRGEAVFLPNEERASGKDRMRFVMYSHGNFVANQIKMETLTSVLLKMTIGVDAVTGDPYFKSAGYIPIYIQRRNVQGDYRHTVWPLELALDELKAGGKKFNSVDRANIPKAWDYVINILPALELLMLQEVFGRDASAE